MAVLIHERPEGEIVVSECDWLGGVQSFNRILEEHYGDAWQSVWEYAEREDKGVFSAIGIAGDLVVLSAHGLEIGREGITVIPDDGVPWLLIRRVWYQYSAGASSSSSIYHLAVSRSQGLSQIRMDRGWSKSRSPLPFCLQGLL